MSGYSFPSGRFAPKVRSALVVGTGRSGKTTLGNLLATCKNVEYQDEPWALHISSVMTALGLLPREVGKEMFCAAFHELINDTILMRNANFRPADLSTIVNKKTPEEIQSRLTTIATREDVSRFISECDPLFLMAFSTDPSVNLPALISLFPEKTPILHVVRRGVEVARQVEGKGWFSEPEVMAPTQAQTGREVTYRGASAFVYSWVPEGCEEEFLDLDQFGRGLYYWCTLLERSLSVLPKDALTVKYEDLLQETPHTLRLAMEYLRLEPTALTDAALAPLVGRAGEQQVAPTLPAWLRGRAQQLYAHFGYDWI